MVGLRRARAGREDLHHDHEMSSAGMAPDAGWPAFSEAGRMASVSVAAAQAAHFVSRDHWSVLQWIIVVAAIVIVSVAFIGLLFAMVMSLDNCLAPLGLALGAAVLLWLLWDWWVR